PWASCPLCPARIVLYHHESTIIPQQFLQGQPDVELVRIWPQLVGQYRSSSILVTRKDGVGTVRSLSNYICLYLDASAWLLRFGAALLLRYLGFCRGPKYPARWSNACAIGTNATPW